MMIRTGSVKSFAKVLRQREEDGVWLEYNNWIGTKEISNRAIFNNLLFISKVFRINHYLSQAFGRTSDECYAQVLREREKDVWEQRYAWLGKPERSGRIILRDLLYIMVAFEDDPCLSQAFGRTNDHQAMMDSAAQVLMEKEKDVWEQYYVWIGAPEYSGRIIFRNLLYIMVAFGDDPCLSQAFGRTSDE